jgi:Protein of unknown function (DUF3618)
MTDTSRELEHEAEASRARLSRLLDELRLRVSPGEVVERLMHDANRNGSGSEFLRTLRQQVRSNPIACMLIAAGITWMMLSDLQKNRATNEARAIASRRTRARRAAAKSRRPQRRSKPRKTAKRRA